ncbi:unnamed protein product [Ceutorhynchus assimilis]|uniref:Protein krueppel n=1 Tax=Ceutorhynchus assimilis TaxID=467358 RepID=A0A9P0DFD9_9CUCU|nr:unnamed protein product [Ceutorhynchus assimilis]
MEVEQNYEGDDYHHTIEPMVIINSQEDEEEKNNTNFKDTSQEITKTSSKNTGPDVSIFPLKKKPKASFKIKLFGNRFANKAEFFEEDDYNNTQTKTIRTPGCRTPVRLITKEEALMADEPYAKRKSSPLEQCPLCKKFFRRMKTHLLKHEVLQNQEACAGLICMICNKAFNNHTNLQIHMRTHTGDKPYICDVCDKSFSQSCNLVNHMRIHTGEKPFKCPHCDRAFTQSGNLNNHIRLHTDEKPFKCHACDKAFVQSGNLNSHIRNNHRVKLVCFTT